ncbi:MAG: hypothetical protein QW717_00510 [Candidatus Bathyarchaeia archaeon]
MSRQYVNEISKEISQLLKDKLKNDINFFKVMNQFEYLVNLQPIIDMYKLAADISKRSFINVHDFTHALYVCKYAILYHSFLYPLIKNNPNIPRAMDDEWESSFVILSGAICHDAGRSYFRQRPEMGYDRIREEVEKGVHVHMTSPEKELAAKHAIEECVAYHEGKEEAPHYEAGIVMLADVTDNDKTRVYPTEDEEVLRKDKEPINYYACLGVDSITLEPMSQGVKIKITLRDYAGVFVFQEIKRRRELSRLKDFVKIDVHLNINNNVVKTIENL